MQIGHRLGAYEVIAKLGEGGMGEVYRARDTKLNRDVAIKVLPEAFASDAERLARFTREAQTLAALNHPNIAQIYGIEGNALVMELVEGDDLSALIANGALQDQRALQVSDVLPIARQIAEALEAAHEHGIVHRDLKPANIKVRADGTVKVLDFGLAKAMDPAAASSGSAMNSPTITAAAFAQGYGGPGTQMGMILGTAAYMAPEQARGKPVDKRADVWAFGVVLYEMLTGRRAFAGDEISDVLAAVLRQDIDWTALPPDTPPRLRRLLERCLDRDVKQRLRDIGEARVEIAKIESGAPDSVSGVIPIAAMREPSWRRALPWVVAAVAVVVASILATDAYRRPATRATAVWMSIPPPVKEFGDRPASAVSADGRRVVFSARDASGKEHLWVRALDAQSSTMIPSTEGARLPFWSPDGQSVGFFRNQKLERSGSTAEHHRCLRTP